MANQPSCPRASKRDRIHYRDQNEIEEILAISRDTGTGKNAGIRESTVQRVIVNVRNML